MIALLGDLFVLLLLLGCGFASAALGLRRLDAGQPPPLGLSYHVYLLIPRTYGLIVRPRALPDVELSDAA